MKINLVIGATFEPHESDRNKGERYVLTIVDAQNDIYHHFGIDRDNELSKPYLPCWHRTLDREAAIRLRDLLTHLINEVKYI